MNRSFITYIINRCLLTVGVAAMLTACHSTRTAVDSRGQHSQASVPVRRTPTGQVSEIENSIGTELVRAALGWMGTPYAYGGESADGVDCSGLTRIVYQDITSIQLPHNSAKQLQYCLSVDREQLRPGDLVFFTDSARQGIGHVGVYIGHGEMVHASSSKGVIASDIDSGYWAERYVCGGRVPGVTQAVQAATPTQLQNGPVQIVIGANGPELKAVPVSPPPAAQPQAKPAVDPDIDSRVKNAFN